MKLVNAPGIEAYGVPGRMNAPKLVCGVLVSMLTLCSAKSHHRTCSQPWRFHLISMRSRLSAAPFEAEAATDGHAPRPPHAAPACSPRMSINHFQRIGSLLDLPLALGGAGAPCMQ